MNLKNPTFITKQEVCNKYPQCVNCPLVYGSCDCKDMEQNEINDIMHIVETVERHTHFPFHKFGMSKEIMARIRAKLIWNKED